VGNEERPSEDEEGTKRAGCHASCQIAAQGSYIHRPGMRVRGGSPDKTGGTRLVRNVSLSWDW